MSSAVAIRFSNSLLDFYAGNQGIAEAVSEIVNLNVTNVLAQQNNDAG